MLLRARFYRQLTPPPEEAVMFVISHNNSILMSANGAVPVIVMASYGAAAGKDGICGRQRNARRRRLRVYAQRQYIQHRRCVRDEISML